MLGVAVPIGVPGVLFLDARRVGQNQPAKVAGAGSAKHRTAKSIRDQTRQITNMVQMGVRQDDGIDLGGRHR